MTERAERREQPENMAQKPRTNRTAVLLMCATIAKKLAPFVVVTRTENEEMERRETLERVKGMSDVQIESLLYQANVIYNDLIDLDIQETDILQMQNGKPMKNPVREFENGVGAINRFYEQRKQTGAEVLLDHFTPPKPTGPTDTDLPASAEEEKA